MKHLHDTLAELLKKFDGCMIDVVETGTIRGNADASYIGDGWSTLYFADRGHVTSIDLDTSIARRVVEVEGVSDRVTFLEGDSREALRGLKLQGARFDVAFLDSENDEQLTLDEFLIVRSVIRPGGLILIDDVEPPGGTFGARKGLLVQKLLDGVGISYKLEPRDGWRGYRPNVLAVEVDHLDRLDHLEGLNNG